VSVEDVCVLFAEGRVEARFGLLQLAPGDLDGIPESSDLEPEIAFREDYANDATSRIVNHEG
jgi:hypothetical protein